MRASACSVFALCLLVVYADGQFGPTGQPVHVNDGNFSHRDHMKLELHPWSGLCETLDNAAALFLNYPLTQLEWRVLDVKDVYVKLSCVIWNRSANIFFCDEVSRFSSGHSVINDGSICQFFLVFYCITTHKEAVMPQHRSVKSNKRLHASEN